MMQNGAMRRYSNHLPDLSRGPSSNIVARMSLGEPNPYTSMPVLGGHGLYQTSSSTSSHNNSALHSQPFRLDDVSAQIGHTPPRANRALTTPVPSAFQQLATQECESPHPHSAFLPFAKHTVGPCFAAFRVWSVNIRHMILLWKDSLSSKWTEAFFKRMRYFTPSTQIIWTRTLCLQTLSVLAPGFVWQCLVLHYPQG